MRCDEVLTRAAGFDGADDDVARHVEACAACRETLSASREGADAFAAFERGAADGPPVGDVREIARRARRARPRVGRLVSRAAVLLVAAAGGFAFAELRAAPTLSRGDVDASVNAAFVRLAERFDARDRRRADEAAETADVLDERRRADTAALVEELSALRREVVALRLVQRSFVEAAAPALPDPR